MDMFRALYPSPITKTYIINKTFSDSASAEDPTSWNVLVYPLLPQCLGPRIRSSMLKSHPATRM